MSGAEQTSEAAAPSDGGVVIAGYRYLRSPVALHFPSEAEVPESKRHLELRTLLYQFLHFAFRKEASVGCDQFVYWDPTDPRGCLAPDEAQGRIATEQRVRELEAELRGRSP